MQNYKKMYHCPKHYGEHCKSVKAETYVFTDNQYEQVAS